MTATEEILLPATSMLLAFRLIQENPDKVSAASKKKSTIDINEKLLIPVHMEDLYVLVLVEKRNTVLENYPPV